MRFWRIYAYTIALLNVVTLGVELTRGNVLRLLDCLPGLLAVAGLLGYAHQRRVLWRWGWMAVAVLLPLWDIAMGALVYPRLEPNTSASTPEYFLLMPLFFPEYWALFRYAFRSPGLWARRAPSALAHVPESPAGRVPPE
jgi:hypothetical protein